MSIATYSDLQTAIASWIARQDLAANIPDFIALFESVANRRLRLRQQESAATLTPSSGVAALPADYLACSPSRAQTSRSRRATTAHSLSTTS